MKSRHRTRRRVPSDRIIRVKIRSSKTSILTPTKSHQESSLSTITPTSILNKSDRFLQKELTYDHHRLRPKPKKSRKKLIISLLTTFLLLILIIIGVVLLIILFKPKKAINRTAQLRWNRTGTVVAGAGGYGNGANQFKGPWDIALDWQNTMYISDRYNHRVQKYLLGASNGTTVAGNPNGIAGTSLYDLNEATGVAIDRNGNIYATDRNNLRVLFYENGTLLGKIVAGDGTLGLGNSQLQYPYDIKLDEDSNSFYLSDNFNHRIMRYSLSGNISGSLVAGGNGCGTNSNQMCLPVALHIDSLTNSLIIANDAINCVVRWVLSAANRTLISGNMNGTTGTSATEFSSAVDVILDPMGNMYVADRFNHRIQFFLPNQSAGTTILGVTGKSGYNGTLLNVPNGITLDSQLNLYVAELNNNRVQKFLRY